MGKEVRHRLYKGQPEGKQVNLHIGQTFTSIHTFRDCLKKYVILECVVLNRIKNEKFRVTALCTLPNCYYRIHTSLIINKVTFIIRTMNAKDYKCDRVVRNLEKNQFLDCSKIVCLN